MAIALSELQKRAREISDALVGRHGEPISLIELCRHQFECERQLGEQFARLEVLMNRTRRARAVLNSSAPVWTWIRRSSPIP